MPQSSVAQRLHSHFYAFSSVEPGVLSGGFSPVVTVNHAPDPIAKMLNVKINQ